MQSGKKCTVIGCHGIVVAKDLCATHYKRVQRHGHLEQTRDSDWGCRERHPLYKTWNWLMRRYGKEVCEAWKDLWVFVADVGDTRPSERHRMARLDGASLFGPTNFYWREPSSTTKGPEARASLAAYQKQYRAANLRKAWNSNLQKYYGITADQYERMLEEQGHVCASCEGPETSVDPVTNKIRRLAVDHCHDTGAVRGLLCSSCNTGLGAFKDRIDLLEKGLRYLRKHKETIQ